MATDDDVINQAIRSTSEVIYEIAMPFPISSKIILTRQKLIYESGGLMSRHVYTINPDEIDNVTGSIGPVFGVIYIVHKDKDFPSQIGLFKRTDIITMKRIVNGYVIAGHLKINTDVLSVAKLIPLLTKLGTDDPSIKK